MFIVTGGAGFIGSNIVKGLNQRGITNIVVVDELTDGTKFKNIASCEIADYLDKDEFIKWLENKNYTDKLEAIFHEGACSTTTEWNGRLMMENNYTYSKKLFHAAVSSNIPFIYASSAAVYGLGTIFKEQHEFEQPLNVYGYSKLQFDRYVQRFLPNISSQIVGLRYFNVYGPGESHKGTMASVMYHFYHQVKAQDSVKLFEGNDDYPDGEQRRDFIYIDDVVKINLWLLDHGKISGIYNVGTGESRSFNDVARAVIAYQGSGTIDYIAFPDHLKGHYQSFTEADISRLRQVGYSAPFCPLEEGVRRYLTTLDM